MKTLTKKIMYNSPEAAQIKTVTGWVSSNGRFWGNDEHMARYDGSTHKLCSCGEVIEKHYVQCNSCHSKKWDKKYEDYTFKEWDEVTPVYDHATDKYFFSVDDLEDYLEEEDITPDALQLVLCTPNYASEIELSYWEDVMTDDMDELPKEIMAAIDHLNKVIRESKPISWSPSNVRTKTNV